MRSGWLLCVIFSLLTYGAHAQDFVFTGATNSFWSVPENWLGGVAPPADSNVTIEAKEVIVDVNIKLFTLRVLNVTHIDVRAPGVHEIDWVDWRGKGSLSGELDGWTSRTTRVQGWLLVKGPGRPNLFNLAVTGGQAVWENSEVLHPVDAGANSGVSARNTVVSAPIQLSATTAIFVQERDTWATIKDTVSGVGTEKKECRWATLGNVTLDLEGKQAKIGPGVDADFRAGFAVVGPSATFDNVRVHFNQAILDVMSETQLNLLNSQVTFTSCSSVDKSRELVLDTTDSTVTWIEQTFHKVRATNGDHTISQGIFAKGGAVEFTTATVALAETNVPENANVKFTNCRVNIFGGTYDGPLTLESVNNTVQIDTATITSEQLFTGADPRDMRITGQTMINRVRPSQFTLTVTKALVVDGTFAALSRTNINCPGIAAMQVMSFYAKNTWLKFGSGTLYLSLNSIALHKGADLRFHEGAIIKSQSDLQFPTITTMQDDNTLEGLEDVQEQEKTPEERAHDEWKMAQVQAALARDPLSATVGPSLPTPSYIILPAVEVQATIAVHPDASLLIGRSAAELPSVNKEALSFKGTVESTPTRVIVGSASYMDFKGLWTVMGDFIVMAEAEALRLKANSEGIVTGMVDCQAPLYFEIGASLRLNRLILPKKTILIFPTQASFEKETLLITADKSQNRDIETELKFQVEEEEATSEKARLAWKVVGNKAELWFRLSDPGPDPKPDPDPDPDPEHDDDKPPGTNWGLIAGAAGGGLLLLSAIGFCIYKKRRANTPLLNDNYEALIQ